MRELCAIGMDEDLSEAARIIAQEQHERAAGRVGPPDVEIETVPLFQEGIGKPNPPIRPDPRLEQRFPGVGLGWWIAGALGLIICYWYIVHA